jgi:hypothetical protein
MPWSTELESRLRYPKANQFSPFNKPADYILKLPKAEQHQPEWQAATEALILAAGGRGPLLHARVGMLRGLNRGVERVFNSNRKDTN